MGGRDCYWPTLIGATRCCRDPAKNWRTQEPMTMGHRLLANVSKFYIMSFLCLLYYLPHYKELIAEKKKKIKNIKHRYQEPIWLLQVYFVSRLMFNVQKRTRLNHILIAHYIVVVIRTNRGRNPYAENLLS